MSTDYRALCEQLMELVEGKRYDGSAVVAKARAALAQPEPVAPTDEELLELMPQQMRDDLATAARALAAWPSANVKAANALRIILNRQAVNHARAALAKWGGQ